MIREIDKRNFAAFNTRFIKSVEPMYQEGILIEGAINYLHGQKENFGFQQKEIVVILPPYNKTGEWWPVYRAGVMLGFKL